MINNAKLVVSRTIEVLLALLGVIIFIVDDDLAAVAIAVWDVLAVGYLLIRVRRLKGSKRSEGLRWLDRGLSGRSGLLFTIFTSVVGITAGLDIVVANDDTKLLFQVAGLPCVVLAWAILHFGYAERYAKDYYAAEADDKPLSFPGDRAPSFTDFAYFSFTIGATFSVSDVDTRNSSIRGRIISHSILSFFYNTATIGIAVSVITG